MNRITLIVFLLAGFAVAGLPVVAEEVDPREPGFLGVQLREETEDPDGGARVTRVVEGSPAETGGLRAGDVIVAFDSAVIRGPLALTERIHAAGAGGVVTVRVKRDGEERSFEIELGNRARTVRPGWPAIAPPAAEPPEPGTVWILPGTPGVGEDPDAPELRIEPPIPLERFFSGTQPFGMWDKPVLGVQLVETTPELRLHLGGESDAGVLVSKILPGMPAEQAGVQVGDLIVAVDGEPVATSDELVRELRDKAGESFELEVVREGSQRTLEVLIPDRRSDRPTGPRA